MDILIAYLSEQNLKPAAFARGVGLSSGYVNNLLKGRKKPSGETAMKIHRFTRGAVPFEAWFEPSKKPKRKG